MGTVASSPIEPVGSQVALLHRISGIVSSDMTLESMLQELIDLVVSVTNCEACLVYLLDQTSGEIVLRASQLPHAAEIGRLRLRAGEGVTGWVAQHRAVVALPTRAYADPRFKFFTSLPEDTYEAFLSVPLISGGEVIGVINVHHTQPRRHSAEEVALVAFVAEHMGGAIAKARLVERSETAARRVETLAAVFHTITTQSYLDRILQVISEVVADSFASPLCSIMIVDQERQELVTKAASCSSPEYLQKPPIKIEDSLIGGVVRDRKQVAVRDVAEEKQYRYPELARRTGLASLLSVPLIARDGAIGTLNIYTREQRVFTEDEVGFAKAVAGQAALAIENARLMAETLEMKRTLEARKIIERAKGILQYRNGLTEEEAYLRLRNESRRLRRPMRELSEAIILAEDLHRKTEGRDQDVRDLPDSEAPPAPIVS
jgi:GAF domain-containing protein